MATFDGREEDIDASLCGGASDRATSGGIRSVRTVLYTWHPRSLIVKNKNGAYSSWRSN